MSRRIVFIGPPGSGKGTQAAALAREGFVHLSSGELLRREIEAGTAQGAVIAAIMRQGGLVPDEILYVLMEHFLSQPAQRHLILDGYPRSLAQAQRLQLAGVDAAVFFEVADEVILRRLENRVLGADGAVYDLILRPPPAGLAYKRRLDDEPSVYLRRIHAYREREKGLREFYAGLGLYHALDASLHFNSVRNQLRDLLASLAAQPTCPA